MIFLCIVAYNVLLAHQCVVIQQLHSVAYGANETIIIITFDRHAYTAKPRLCCWWFLHGWQSEQRGLITSQFIMSYFFNWLLYLTCITSFYTLS